MKLFNRKTLHVLIGFTLLFGSLALPQFTPPAHAAATNRHQVFVTCAPGLQTGILNTDPAPVTAYANCTVSVFVTGTTTQPQLYSDNAGTTTTNSFTTGAGNAFGSFYIDDGTYDINIVNTSSTPALSANRSVGIVVFSGSQSQFGYPTATFCGATSGSVACANAVTGGTGHVVGGIATLSSNSAVISGISPTFTSTSTYACVANDLTTRANPVQVANTSATSITITNTTGASDVINWVCVGY